MLQLTLHHTLPTCYDMESAIIKSLEAQADSGMQCWHRMAACYVVVILACYDALCSSNC